MAGYDLEFTTKTARNCIRNAKYYFEKERALLRVCSEMHSGLMWAIESWLLRNRYELDCRHGWNSVMAQFADVAPKHLRSKTLYILHKIVLSDSYNPIEGPQDGTHVDYEKWKCTVRSLLVDVEKAIEILDEKGVP